MTMRIRLAMHGHRNRRIFHLVAVHSHKRRNAQPTELLGIYDPHLNDQGRKPVEWAVDRIRYWLSVGAQPTKSAVKLLEVGNIIPPNSHWHPASHAQKQERRQLVEKEREEWTRRHATKQAEQDAASQATTQTTDADKTVLLATLRQRLAQEKPEVAEIPKAGEKNAEQLSSSDPTPLPQAQ
ncbi:ribosomal protein S16 domain-containing protein [Schizophyllum amplum]|uniref:Ribosomal protein S16 domain-containing protein n=1 Tax=Schizophyllum amplum TaxID=97359 RepID=A0A550C648_9AGAR|nr:ribosomal protein S16 domain-containing protein [Auriculariopsis ampla]